LRCGPFPNIFPAATRYWGVAFESGRQAAGVARSAGHSAAPTFVINVAMPSIAVANAAARACRSFSELNSNRPCESTPAGGEAFIAASGPRVTATINGSVSEIGGSDLELVRFSHPLPSNVTTYAIAPNNQASLIGAPIMSVVVPLDSRPEHYRRLPVGVHRAVNRHRSHLQLGPDGVYVLGPHRVRGQRWYFIHLRGSSQYATCGHPLVRWRLANRSAGSWRHVRLSLHVPDRGRGGIVAADECPRTGFAGTPRRGNGVGIRGDEAASDDQVVESCTSCSVRSSVQ
jgi:hypothetical protein